VKFARVIGRVTLNVADPAFAGGRFLIGMPCAPDSPEAAHGKPLPKGNSLVIYDSLGATENDLIAYTDGGEAAAPFAEPTPCDAYNAAILDGVFYDPPLTD
jgi:ethanolamine utilization protein EutN